MFMFNIVGSRGKGFIVLFIKNVVVMIKNVYVIFENGVDMNIIIFLYLDVLIKS